MNALILAAGLGTRLLPYTRELPKPLFTLLSKPVLEHAICQLADAGCKTIAINTHHLHGQIESFLKGREFGVQLHLLHEPEILDTGGAIANALPLLGDNPFFVVNADIISNIRLNDIYQAHLSSGCLATLVLHDDERFNKVAVDGQGKILGFNAQADAFAFTGVQVLSPEIRKFFPDKKKFSSIEVYQKLCSDKKIGAYIDKGIFWSDIGTPDDYKDTSFKLLAASGMDIPLEQIGKITITQLAGDGSDRRWYRAAYQEDKRIIADHDIGLDGTETRRQTSAFINIGRHLFKKGIPVPRIHAYDKLSGMVLVEDLGNIHFEEVIRKSRSDASVEKLYQKVINLLIQFSTEGLLGFDADWTCQTRTYSKELILEKECRYFMEAFTNDYLKLDISFDALLTEFEFIADKALDHAQIGLMHRDMQSRNIMVRDGKPCFIDFQSARIGPLQYDLASLLIDPYVELSTALQKDLVEYTIKRLNLTQEQTRGFMQSYDYCCLTRNMQALGAFSFLSQVKKKAYFEGFIPAALNTLHRTFKRLDTEKLKGFGQLLARIDKIHPCKE